jgi:hypothetical protein
MREGEQEENARKKGQMAASARLLVAALRERQGMRGAGGRGGGLGPAMQKGDARG